MNRKKSLAFYLFFLFSQVLFAKGGVLVLQKGPLSLPFVSFLQENSLLKTKLVYDSEQALESLLTGECEYAVFSLDAAYEIFESTNEKIFCAAVTGKSNAWLVSKRSKMDKLSDFFGLKVYVSKDSLSRKMFTKILEQKGINIEKSRNGIQIIPVQDEFSLVNGFLNNEYENIVVSYPLLELLKTKMNTSLSVIDLQKQNEIVIGKDNDFVFSVLVCRKDFAMENSDLHSEIMSEIQEKFIFSSDFSEMKTFPDLLNFKKIGFLPSNAFEILKNGNYVFSFAKYSKNELESTLKTICNTKRIKESFFLDF